MGPGERGTDGVGSTFQFQSFVCGVHTRVCGMRTRVCAHMCGCVPVCVSVCVCMLVDVRGEPMVSPPTLLFEMGSLTALDSLSRLDWPASPRDLSLSTSQSVCVCVCAFGD